ncbi:LacI family DNA-binding transcriptional regulator [Lancefieldella rimae]|uniref:LacI family DNA-binding transcriptional regulator n=1 Tax=Lancefieldella rimae TaxID=1383 RepID=UPI002889B911|nr:LacI family DNA-binding transcriptional regulator [Lancefieldella rimae]
MKPTARDVAKAAGVSPATVSLVFRNRPGIGKETRDHVFACAQKLGFEYAAHEAERSTSTILLLVYKRHGQVVGDTPFFESLTKSLSDATYKYGYHRLSVSYFYAQEDKKEQIKALKSVKCAGIILLATEALADDIAQFERLGVPIVLLDSWFPTKKLDSVAIDNSRGSWEAVRYFLGAGHTNIGYLHCGVTIRNFLERQEGFYSAMRGVDPESRSRLNVIRVGSTIEAAYDDMCAYLETDPKLCTAYFADNDIVAVGCMRALTEHGIKIPDDVSLIGFDDTVYCEMTDPPLTTMVVNKEAMGELAIKRLVELIKGTTNGEVIRISILPTIVERKSVRRLESPS